MGGAAPGWLGVLEAVERASWAGLEVTFRLPRFFSTPPPDPLLSKALLSKVGVASDTSRGPGFCSSHNSLPSGLCDPLIRFLEQKTYMHL